MDNVVYVRFRRERTYLEFQAEKEGLGKPDPERFVTMGELAMATVPEEGRFIFVNGASYKVANVTWSIKLNPLPGQPNFDDPQVLITLQAMTDHTNGLAPQSDFFE